jgi:hypothetical protein
MVRFNLTMGTIRRRGVLTLSSLVVIFVAAIAAILEIPVDDNIVIDEYGQPVIDCPQP